jgi:hypothetical protein
MPLIELPPEILFEIFSYLGSSYFRSDLSRLAVCKRWSKFALLEYFREFQLNQRTLRALMSSPYAESSLSLARDNAIHLDLRITGFGRKEWTLLRPQDEYPKGHGYQVATKRDWNKELEANICKLTDVLSQRQRLRTLSIEFSKDYEPECPHNMGTTFIQASSIDALLSVGSLTSLDLDLLRFHNPRQGWDEKPHLCVSVAALLPTLRRLRLRMYEICPVVLQPQKKSNDLPLTDLLVNLSMMDTWPNTSTSHVFRCDRKGDHDPVKDDLVEHAQALVAQMAAPKTVKILTHTRYPEYAMQAFDVLTGKEVKLGRGIGWYEDGMGLHNSHLFPDD